MRTMIVAVAVLAGFLPAPASALTPEQVDCPMAEAPADFPPHFADAMIADDVPDAEMGDLFRQLASLADGCVAKTGVPAAQRKAYFGFVMVRLPAVVYRQRLEQAGIATDVLEEVMDLGPGASNPRVTAITGEQAERIAGGLAARGVNVSGITDEAWNMVGGYIAAASQMYRAMDEMR